MHGPRGTRRAANRLKLATHPPFHLEATVRVLQRRPTNRVDRWEDGRYVRVLPTAAGELVLVEVENRGTIDDPDVRFAFRPGSAPSPVRVQIERTIRAMLGLDVDPALLQRVGATARRLRVTTRALRGMRPPRFAGLFEAFANVVPFQQVSLDAGVAVVGRLVERFGRSLELDGRRFHAFPSAGAIAGARVAALRTCGLSTQKAASLRALAAIVASGTLTEETLSRMGSAEALRCLAELPGIGPWSASLVLLRGLGRLDVFPPGDVGATRGLGALLGLRPRTPLEPIVARFGHGRGYLYFCSLADSLLARGLIHPAPRPVTWPRQGPVTGSAPREGSSFGIAPRGRRR